MKAQDYFPLIRQWAHDRDIINESTRHAQFCKLVEESGEIEDDPLDGIGDTIVVIVIIAAQSGLKLEELKDITYTGKSFISDLGVLANAISKSKPVEAGLGNVYAHCEFLCGYFGLEIEDCMAQAWGDIKDRKGKMVAGVFVKEEDL